MSIGNVRLYIGTKFFPLREIPIATEGKHIQIGINFIAVSTT